MYSDRFNKFIDFIWSWECVFAKGHYGDYNYVITENVDGDPGGLTKWGIDQNSQPHVNIKDLTQEGSKQIYWTNYWEKYKCESYAPGLGECVMNCCVNAGSGRANIILKTAKTADEFIKGQEDFYKRLVNQKPSFQKFLKGWLNRTAALRKFLNL